MIESHLHLRAHWSERWVSSDSRLRLPWWSIRREECDYRIAKSVRRATGCRKECRGAGLGTLERLVFFASYGCQMLT